VKDYVHFTPSNLKQIISISLKWKTSPYYKINFPQGRNIKLKRRFFVSDCEGPLSINDNAFELSGKYINDGERFFQIISRYDDILADEIKRPGYNAGGTLKLILPFLKAYDATNKDITEFSEETVLLVPGARDTLQFVYCTMPSFIVSTSYQQYIQALCNITGFPFENTYSTLLDVDKYSVTPAEKTRLMELREDVLKDSSFENLEKIFWEIIPQMSIGKIIEDVDPVGGEGKKDAVMDIMKRFQFQASDLMYVGDSITDVQPLRYAFEKGGLAVAFNGNEYAVGETEIAIMADNTLPISILADLFNKGGREEVIEFIGQFKEEPQRALYDYPVDSQLALKYPSRSNIQIDIVDEQNREKIKEESLKYRKNVRGESIGELG
jgi:energy-converting hydrogenase A subunit R